MRFIVLIFTFLLQSQSQPIQETNESETEIVCPDNSSEVNCSNDDENISRKDDDSIFETSEKNDNGKLIRLRITIVLRRLYHIIAVSRILHHIYLCLIYEAIINYEAHSR